MQDHLNCMKESQYHINNKYAYSKIISEDACFVGVTGYHNGSIFLDMFNAKRFLNRVTSTKQLIGKISGFVVFKNGPGYGLPGCIEYTCAAFAR